MKGEAMSIFSICNTSVEADVYIFPASRQGPGGVRNAYKDQTRRQSHTEEGGSIDD